MEREGMTGVILLKCIMTCMWNWINVRRNEDEL